MKRILTISLVGCLLGANQLFGSLKDFNKVAATQPLNQQKLFEIYSNMTVEKDKRAAETKFRRLGIVPRTVTSGATAAAAAIPAAPAVARATPTKDQIALLAKQAEEYIKTLTSSDADEEDIELAEGFINRSFADIPEDVLNRLTAAYSAAEKRIKPSGLNPKAKPFVPGSKAATKGAQAEEKALSEHEKRAAELNQKQLVDELATLAASSAPNIEWTRALLTRIRDLLQLGTLSNPQRELLNSALVRAMENGRIAAIIQGLGMRVVAPKAEDEAGYTDGVNLGTNWNLGRISSAEMTTELAKFKTDYPTSPLATRKLEAAIKIKQDMEADSAATWGSKTLDQLTDVMEDADEIAKLSSADKKAILARCETLLKAAPDVEKTTLNKWIAKLS